MLRGWTVQLAYTITAASCQVFSGWPRAGSGVGEFQSELPSFSAAHVCLQDLAVSYIIVGLMVSIIAVPVVGYRLLAKVSLLPTRL